MKKYLHVINIGIQNTLVYRANFLFRASFSLIPLTAIILMWRTVYEGKAGGTVGQYSLAQMISYYLLVTIVDMATAVTEDDWQIASDIREGNISQFILKPIDYMAYRICLFFSGRLIYTSVALIPVGLFIFYHRSHFVWPDSAGALAFFLVSLFITACLQFFMSYTMALLAFWVLEVATFIFILFAFEYLAGGHLFPLDILPPTAAALLQLTPFPYMLYFPISVYLGRIRGGDLYYGLAMQAAWALAMFCVARFVWSRGIKKYSAVGG